MAKNTVILYTDYLEQFEELTYEEIGIITTAMLKYQLGEPLPEMNKLLNLIFIPIKKQIDRANEAYVAKCEKNKKNIAKRWDEKQNTNVYERIPSYTNEYEPIRSDTKNTDNDNGIDSDIDNDKDNDTDKDNDKDIKKEIYKEKSRFVPPRIDEVAAYCLERGNHINPDSFIDFYQAKNWMIGKNKMKDWKAAIRTWERKNKATNVVDLWADA